EWVGAPKPRTRDRGYGTFLRILIAQQISVAAADSIEKRLRQQAPDLSVAQLVRLSDDHLRSAGLSRPKIKTLRRLIEAIENGSFDPDGLEYLSDDEVIQKISSLHGFGRWSAEIYCMFSLGRPDVFAGDDIALLESIRRLDRLEQRPTPKQGRIRAEKWKPHRTCAALFLWHYYRGQPA
ncbi:MAG: DNA-3-methyladenine glycosylase 2 family protein, partial [Pseudomonadota bacterium]